MVIFFYLCLANLSDVIQPNRTEGAEIYAGCGIPGCCKMFCAVYTPLCAGLCAARLCYWLFSCCRDFAFRTSTICFWEIYKTCMSTSIHRIYHVSPVRTLPRRSPGGKRFAVRTVQLSSLSRGMCGVLFSTTWHCLRPLHA